MCIKEANRETIVNLLESIERKGMDGLVIRLVTTGFFDSPASTKFHGCYEGGLAQHSLNVYSMLVNINEELKLKISKETLIIACLLHDICKVGAYIPKGDKYIWNRAHPRGHATLSLGRISEHITLTELEETMIRYHMGIYGLVEAQDKGKEHKGEYTLRKNGLYKAWFHHPIVKVMYFCDELDSLKERKI